MKSGKTMAFFDLKQKTHCYYIQPESERAMLLTLILTFSFNMTKE